MVFIYILIIIFENKVSQSVKSSNKLIIEKNLQLYSKYNIEEEKQKNELKIIHQDINKKFRRR